MIAAHEHLAVVPVVVALQAVVNHQQLRDRAVLLLP